MPDNYYILSSDGELYHWKYIDKEKTSGGKWRYIYERADEQHSTPAVKSKTSSTGNVANVNRIANRITSAAKSAAAEAARTSLVKNRTVREAQTAQYKAQQDAKKHAGQTTTKERNKKSLDELNDEQKVKVDFSSVLDKDTSKESSGRSAKQTAKAEKEAWKEQIDSLFGTPVKDLTPMTRKEREAAILKSQLAKAQAEKDAEKHAAKTTTKETNKSFDFSSLDDGKTASEGVKNYKSTKERMKNANSKKTQVELEPVFKEKTSSGNKPADTTKKKTHDERNAERNATVDFDSIFDKDTSSGSSNRSAKKTAKAAKEAWREWLESMKNK